MDDDLYYIENLRVQSDCRLWWRVDGHGYTYNLDHAWRVTKDHALRICRSRPDEDIPRPASEIEELAVRHVPR